MKQYHVDEDKRQTFRLKVWGGKFWYSVKRSFLLRYLSKQSEGLPCTGVVLSVVERLRPEQEDHFGMGLPKRLL